MKNNPEFLETAMARLSGKTIPKYIQDFCDWIETDLLEEHKVKLKGLRTRKSIRWEKYSIHGTPKIGI